MILTVASADIGLSLFAVDGAAAGLGRCVLPTLDQTRKLASLEFSEVSARLIGSPGAAWAVLDRTLDVAAIALAAEQLGGAQRVLDMAVGYAKIRQQFGRPIGSFQAIKHRCRGSRRSPGRPSRPAHPSRPPFWKPRRESKY